MMKFFNTGYLFIVLFLLGPISFFISRNYTQQAMSGNLASLAAAVLIGLVCCLLCRAALAALNRSARIPDSAKTTVKTALFAAASVAAFPFFFFLSWEGQGPFGVGAAIALSVACVFYLIRVVGYAKLNVFLAIFTAMSLFTLIRAELSEKDALPPPPKPLPHSLAMTKKPNIYFFFLESMHDRKTIADQYGFDAPALFSRLQQENFVAYDNFYTNYVGTLDSALAVFTMRHHYNEYNMNFVDATRNAFTVLAENSVFQILKNNDYNINLFDVNGKYVFRTHSSLVDYTHFSQEKEVMEGVKTTIGLFNPLVSRLIRHQPSNEEAGLAEYATMMEIFSRDYPGKFDFDTPQFFYIHFGASHTGDYEHFYPEPGWKPDWVEGYKADYLQAANNINVFLNAILENDPGALIVMTGDHGGWKHGREVELRNNPDFLMGKRDINAFFRENGVEPGTVGASLGEVLTAIRWPEGIEPPQIPEKGLSHVTLFPFVLSRLAGKEYREEDFERNVSLNLVNMDNRFMVFARDGKLLENWEIMLLKDRRLTDQNQ